MYIEPKHICSSYNKNNYGETFYNLVLKLKPMVIVEFGLLHGYSTVALAQGLRDVGNGGHIFAYDLFDDYKYSHGSVDVIENNLKFYGLTSYVTIGKMNFCDWIDNPQRFDFLHVDISNDGEVVGLLKSKLARQIESGATVVFEGGSQDRDAIDWMVRYKKAPINPLQYELNFEVLRNDYPSMSKFK